MNGDTTRQEKAAEYVMSLLRNMDIEVLESNSVSVCEAWCEAAKRGVNLALLQSADCN